jgi:hypothetical protein
MSATFSEYNAAVTPSDKDYSTKFKSLFKSNKDKKPRDKYIPLLPKILEEDLISDDGTTTDESYSSGKTTPSVSFDNLNHGTVILPKKTDRDVKLKNRKYKKLFDDLGSALNCLFWDLNLKKMRISFNDDSSKSYLDIIFEGFAKTFFYESLKDAENKIDHFFNSLQPKFEGLDIKLGNNIFKDLHSCLKILKELSKSLSIDESKLLVSIEMKLLVLYAPFDPEMKALHQGEINQNNLDKFSIVESPLLTIGLINFYLKGELNQYIEKAM